MNERWMIYGANGYTGALCAREAVARGMSPVLAGRRKDAIEPLAQELGLEFRTFALADGERAVQALSDIDVVLACAGPFSATARPMLDACAAAGTHYLDITGEIDVFEYVHQHADRWIQAEIVAIPGVGFDVVPTDCLAAMLKRRMPEAEALTLAFRSRHGKMSPGTTKTVIEGLREGGKVRRDGAIVSVPAAYRERTIPFASGEATAVTIPWGDVSTAYYSTGIPNIEVYMGVPPKQVSQMRRVGKLGWLLGAAPVQALLKAYVGRTVKGPNAADREADEMQLWGAVRDNTGRTLALTMRTPEGYALTVDASLRAVARLQAARLAPGAYTPSMAFGPDFVTEMAGVTVSEPVEGTEVAAT